LIQGTRRQILEFLKRRGSSTVDELAGTLELAPMTMRQHLALLERDSLVASVEVRGAKGRPHLSYRITDFGEDVFPNGYSRLAERVLREVMELQVEDVLGRSGEEKTMLLLRRVADRMADAYASRLEGKTLEDRLADALQIMRDEGGQPEWERTESGIYHISDYNCPYLRVVRAIPYVCTWHVRFLTRMLNTKVVRTKSRDEDGLCCVHAVEPR
jgi:predicted ArsR family transcriptional regulator